MCKSARRPRRGIERRAAALPSAYPASFDLRSLTAADGVSTYSRLTAVRDQRYFGTCWAFSNMAALESELMPAESWDFSEDNLVTRSGFGPFPGSYGKARNPYYYGGWDFMAVAYFARWAGPVSEQSDPYGTPIPPKVNHVLKHVQGAVMYPGRAAGAAGDLGNDVIKQLVDDNGALSVGMYWSDDFLVAGPATGVGDAYYCPFAAGDSYDGGTVAENHGVAIVGWDDAYPAASFTTRDGVTPAGDGAFLVRNSWGARASATAVTSGSPITTGPSRATSAPRTRVSTRSGTTAASTSTTSLAGLRPGASTRPSAGAPTASRRAATGASRP